MWLLVTLVLLFIFAVIAMIVLIKNNKKGKRHEPDYYTFFILGIVWIGAGIPLGTSSNNWGLFAVGVLFMILGLANKNKWKNYERPNWKDLSRKERNLRIWTMIILGILVLGLALFCLIRVY